MRILRSGLWWRKRRNQIKSCLGFLPKMEKATARGKKLDSSTLHATASKKANLGGVSFKSHVEKSSHEYSGHVMKANSEENFSFNTI